MPAIEHPEQASLPEFASIGYVANPQARYLMMDVLALARERHDATIHLYCQTAQDKAFYETANTDGLFASITVVSALRGMAAARLPDTQAVVERARAFEHKIGCTYNTLMVADRHFGRGYALAGFRHPRSRQSDADIHQILHALNETLAFWEREIADKGLSLITGSADAAVSRIARASGVPLRILAGSRHKNYHFWADNEFREQPEIAESFAQLDPGESEAMVDDSYLLQQVHKKIFLKRVGVSTVARRSAREILQWVYWRARGYDKARSYFLSETLRHHFRVWRDTRSMTGAAVAPLSVLHGRTFVFFALHTEPEATVGQFSPEFFFQHAAIAALSRDLPAGVLLAVKETIHGVGRRPDNFYDQIRELKNVVMLNMLEDGHDVVRHAAAIATITGTVGFEGAIMGKPVICFGRHNPYDFLDHVFVVHDLARVRESLDKALGPAFDQARAKADGARFLRSVEAVSFDLCDYDYVNLKRYERRAVENAYGALVGSFHRRQALTNRPRVVA